MKMKLLGFALATLPLFGQVPPVPNSDFPTFRSNLNSSLSKAVSIDGNYSNPTWLTSVDWSKLLNVPTFVPTGGTAGQVLAKVDSTNYNTTWVTPSGSSGPTGPAGPTGPIGPTGPSGSASGGNPGTCTDNAGTTICITAAPYYGSGEGATTTTTSGTFGVGTSGSVASCSTFSDNEGVSIAGAGAAGARYIGTVVSCSGTTLTVTPSTSTSVGGGVVVQHDETAAFQSAMDALGSLGGIIYVPIGIYLVNGPLQDTGGANAVLKVPTIAAGTGSTVVPVTLQGFSPATLNYSNGTTIRTSQNTGNFLGGYASGGYYGGFTAISLQINNITFQTTQTNPGVTMINALHILSLQGDQLTIESSASTTPTNTTGLGLRMPGDANNVRQTLDHIFIRGFYTLAILGEHIFVGHLIGTTGHNCFVFEGGVQGNSTTVGYLWHQLCDNFIVGGTNDTTINILAADSEVAIDTMVYDPNNHLKGYINWLVPYNDGRSTSTVTAPVINGGTKLKFNSLAYTNLVLSRPKFNPSYTGELNYVGIAGTATAGHMPVFAANGIDLVDSGGTGGGTATGAVLTVNQNQPTCDSTTTVTVGATTVPIRSAIWFTQGIAGVADKIEVCMKDAANNYAWVTK